MPNNSPPLSELFNQARQLGEWTLMTTPIELLIPEFERTARPDLCLLAQSILDLSLHLEGLTVQSSAELRSHLEGRTQVLIRELELGVRHLFWKRTMGIFEGYGSSESTVVI
ncbi:MAG: hypothetical protein AAB425_15985 [Bdellovibrionota bacterium]